MERTMVIWRKLGKEHDERGYLRINRPAVISAYLQDQVDRFRQLPEAEWRWWQLSEEVIVEKPFAGEEGKPAGVEDWRPARAIYHLPRRKWVVVEDAAVRGFEWAYGWYVHIGDITYNPDYSSWIFTDYFCDVIIREDGQTHSVMDLDDLGSAIALGLITSKQAAGILTDTQKLIDLVRLGGFPPREICEFQKQIDDFGWNRSSE